MSAKLRSCSRCSTRLRVDETARSILESSKPNAADRKQFSEILRVKKSFTSLEAVDVVAERAEESAALEAEVCDATDDGDVLRDETRSQ